MKSLKLLKSFTIVLIALLSLIPFSHAAKAEDYKLDKGHTAVYFRIKHLGMSYTYGRFNDVSGELTVKGTDSKFSFTIQTASVDTALKKRDDHLRNADFFEAKQFPTITFTTNSVKVDGDKMLVTGTLKLHGVSKKITIPLEKMGEGKDPWGNYRIGFNSDFSIKRSDYGMKEMMQAVGDQVDLMISFEGIKAKK